VHVPADVDVRKIRKGIKLSQAEFAARFGLPAATVRDWEQNRRQPEGAARVLVHVIKREPRMPYSVRSRRYGGRSRARPPEACRMG
jgi:DNA-binding transcriptional regulator YiaG